MPRNWILATVCMVLVLAYNNCSKGFTPTTRGQLPSGESGAGLDEGQGNPSDSSPSEEPDPVGESPADDTGSVTPPPENAVFSQLWGRQGENWIPNDDKSRLSEFRFAGYRMGDDLPTLAGRPRLEVRDYGAQVNDGIDDSAAIKMAIEAASKQGGYVHLGKGIYDIDRPIVISNQSNWILRGESREGVILKIDQPLCAVNNDCNIPSGERSSYSFARGFIEVLGSEYIINSNRLASVTANAPRNSRQITLSSVSGIQVGDTITLTQTDTAARSLQPHLHGDVISNSIGDLKGKKLLTFSSRVTEVLGQRVTLERRLPIKVDTSWNPEVYRFAPKVTDVGLVNLTINMNLADFKGHFVEDGYNAIYFSQVMHSWVQNVKIVNADYGVNLHRSQFITVKDVVIDSSDRGGVSHFGNSVVGHHALNNSWGGDHLISNFEVTAPFIHDLTVEWTARGVVFERGRGGNLSLDHHGAIPYMNLFTELDAGLGTRLYVSGGSKSRFPHSGGFNVYWNIKSDADKAMECDFIGGYLSFVAVPGYNDCRTQKWHNEKLDADRIYPQNLYRAQKAL